MGGGEDQQSPIFQEPIGEPEATPASSSSSAPIATVAPASTMPQTIFTWIDGGDEGSGLSPDGEDLEAPCTCTGAKMFPHRKRKCSLRALAPGLYVRNESVVPILFVLSQLTPLHWLKIEPGETKHIKCGRVFFTASTEMFNPETQPTRVGVALRIAAITAVTAFAGTIVGVGIVGG